MNKTEIAWADFTWNPVTGCTPVSEGCENCYAMKMDKRFGDGLFKVALHPTRLDKPARRKKPARIFVCSMSDLFHKDVPEGFILDVWQRMLRAPQHTFMVLTKRPERMREVVERAYTNALPNVWLGVTAENQARADERIPPLLQTPAAHRFVSIEPMLGAVDLHNIPHPLRHPKSDWVKLGALRVLDWVIVGGESGPGARECREEWVQSVYEKCKAAGVPFFFKQHGRSWLPYSFYHGDGERDKSWWLSRREWPEGLKREAGE